MLTPPTHPQRALAWLALLPLRAAYALVPARWLRLYGTRRQRLALWLYCWTWFYAERKAGRA